MDIGGGDGCGDKDVIIEKGYVDKDALTEESTAAAVATPSAG
jgi:hypothetical protein